MQKALGKIYKKWGIQQPDHRADIAEEAWNAALSYARAANQWMIEEVTRAQTELRKERTENQQLIKKQEEEIQALKDEVENLWYEVAEAS